MDGTVDVRTTCQSSNDGSILIRLAVFRSVEQNLQYRHVS